MELKVIHGGESQASEDEAYRQFREALHYIIVDSAKMMESGDHRHLNLRKIEHEGKAYGDWWLQVRRNDPFRAMFTDRIIE